MESTAHSRHDHRWYAVHTKPRQEHIAEAHLARQGFECFLPRAFNPQRKLKSQNPKIEALFPRYLFLRADTGRQNVAPVNNTRGVSRLVRFGIDLAEVPEWVVENLRAAVNDDGLVELAPAGLGCGDAVEVFDGPFAGFKGVFQAPDGERRALVLLELLGRHNTVSVKRRDLRPAR